MAQPSFRRTLPHRGLAGGLRPAPEPSRLLVVLACERQRRTHRARRVLRDVHPRGWERRRDPLQQPRARPSVGSLLALRARRDPPRNDHGAPPRERPARTSADRRDALRGVRHRRRVRARLLRAGRSSRRPRADGAGARPARHPLPRRGSGPGADSSQRGDRRPARPGRNRRHVRRNGSGRRSGTLAPRSRRQRAVLRPSRGAGPPLPAGAPGGDERGRHGDGSGAAAGGARFWRTKRSSSRRKETRGSRSLISCRSGRSSSSCSI